MSGGTVALSTVEGESPKNLVRSHQILSRETSFISKPVSIEEINEPTVPSSVVKSQVTSTPQSTVSLISTSIQASSTITITSKFYKKKIIMLFP